MDQFSHTEDLTTTQAIRQAVMKDAMLSMVANNVIIVANRGRVTLIGLVRSLEQKMKIEALAKSVAGNENVHIQIHVQEATDTAEEKVREQRNRGEDVFQKFVDRAAVTRKRAGVEVRE